MLNLRAGVLMAAGVSAAMLMAATPWEARGQEVRVMGGPGMGGGFGGEGAEAPVDSRRLKRYAELLGLDEDQRFAAEVLLEGMQAEWDAESRRFREAVAGLREEFQQERDPSVWMERMPGLMQKQRDAHARLERSFMEDLRSLLSDGQASSWAAVERAHRRETTMRSGRLSGESVDLVRLAEELRPEGGLPEGAREVLSRYEVDIDRALTARNEVVEKAQSMAGFGPGSMERALQDPEFLRLRERARDARVLVRDTNQRYARQVAAVLPGEEGERWTRLFTERSHPEVFRRSAAEEAMEAALSFDDLTTEQRSSIEAMRSALAAERERSARAWIEAVEKFEATEEGYASVLGNMRVRFGGPGGGEDDSPVGQVRRERREMDRRAEENLRSVLTEGQRERLPKPRERRRGSGPQAMMIGPNGQPVVLEGGEGGGPAMVTVFRSVTTGPDGQPVEENAVFIGGSPARGEGAGVAEGEVEFEFRAPPRKYNAPRPRKFFAPGGFVGRRGESGVSG